ncbi:hypothetical protein AX16_007503 [Volvariella volvacea WC 439]|nr:hypothetical protein AX16_007503 [Volvariella volvacea WC 439]
MSDEEIVEACKSATAIDANTYYIPELNRMNPGCIFLISHDTVATRRDLSPSELDVAELVRQHTCIPVPYHQRCTAPTGAFRERHLVMQYIEGETLYTLWDSVSLWMRFRVALTVRYYVYQLRSLPSRLHLSKPGLVGDYDDLYCDGRLLSKCPPKRFDSYSSLAFWYDECLFMQKRDKRNCHPNITPFDRSRPLAVVHQDLHPRNLLLGADGQLAIFAARNSELPDSWKRLIPYMFGRFEAPGQLPFIRAIPVVLENMPPDFYDFLAEMRARDKVRESESKSFP